MGTPGISVCLVTGEFPPQIGGLGDYTHYLATALAEAGAQVDILTAADAQPAITSSQPHQDALPYQLSHSINGWGRGLFTSVERHIDRLQPQVDAHPVPNGRLRHAAGHQPAAPMATLASPRPAGGHHLSMTSAIPTYSLRQGRCDGGSPDALRRTATALSSPTTTTTTL